MAKKSMGETSPDGAGNAPETVMQPQEVVEQPVFTPPVYVPPAPRQKIVERQGVNQNHSSVTGQKSESECVSSVES